ncbi:MAG: amidohydrolase [Firmicutes bacterium]|nr:amidohydrolase [Bacillota bacterium]
MDIKKMIDNEKLVNWRRHFHMYPEISFKEHESAKYIAAQLKQYPGIEILRPTETGVVAVLKGSLPGKTVGLRADFDALPITEEADVEFKSKNPGAMHACGHDCHAAMLLGAVDVLYKIKDKLPGTVKFIFQHAEELPPGGAIELVKSGVLDDVDVFYGSHVNSDTPVGVVRSGTGPMYAHTDRFEITIMGKGCHAASPHKGIDSLLIGLEVVQALNYIVSRNVPASEPAVLTVGAFNAGTVANVVPDTANIKGTVRTYNPEVRDMIVGRINDLTDGICKAYGAAHTIEFVQGYAAVVNDENLCKLFNEIALETFPGIEIEQMIPIMGGEDFSAFRTIAPSFFSGVGARLEEGEVYPGHHPKYQISEACLPIGCALYIAFALKAGTL